MTIAIEGPELFSVNFDEIQELKKKFIVYQSKLVFQ